MTTLSHRQAREHELRQIIDEFDLPEMRREINFDNLFWMKNNIGIRNSDKPQFHRAQLLIQYLLNEYKNENG